MSGRFGFMPHRARWRANTTTDEPRGGTGSEGWKRYANEGAWLASDRVTAKRNLSLSDLSAVVVETVSSPACCCCLFVHLWCGISGRIARMQRCIRPFCAIIAAVPPRPQDRTACFSHRTHRHCVRLCFWQTVTVTFNTVRCPCNGLVREVSPWTPHWHYITLHYWYRYRDDSWRSLPAHVLLIGLNFVIIPSTMYICRPL